MLFPGIYLSRMKLNDVLAHWVLRKINQKYFLVPIRTTPNYLKEIDIAGKEFWMTLLKEKSINRAAEILSGKYNVSSLTIVNDMKIFIKKITGININAMSLVKEENILIKNNQIIPASGSIELTGRCNLFCFHCYARGESKNQD